MVRVGLLVVRAGLLVVGVGVLGVWGQEACGLLSVEQIKGVVKSGVEAGQAGVANGSNECTWSDARGEDRVYVALRPGGDFRTFRAQIEKGGGRTTAVAGVGEEAFFVSPDESSSALYVLAKNHLLVLTVTLPEGTQQANPAAEKALAGMVIGKL